MNHVTTLNSRAVLEHLFWVAPSQLCCEVMGRSNHIITYMDWINILQRASPLLEHFFLSLMTHNGVAAFDSNADCPCIFRNVQTFFSHLDPTLLWHSFLSPATLRFTFNSTLESFVRCRRSQLLDTNELWRSVLSRLMNSQGFRKHADIVHCHLKE